MTSWQTLLSTALVGTQRRPLPPLDAAVAPLAAQLTTATRQASEPARALLDAAALVTAYRRAGAQPVGGVAAPDPAPEETLPLVPAAAGGRLAALLADHPDHVAEWLTLAASHQWRVPPELLPQLADLAVRREQLRPLLVAAGGARLRWLLDQRPAWRVLTGSLVDTTDPRSWEYGTRDERRGYLAALRADDPAAARDLLAATWRDETALDRGVFLACLATGLSIADEPFCEVALDDRRKEVRTVAADLLARLPGSALARRMTERATRCVRLVDDDAARGPRLAVTPPTPGTRRTDKALQRDGVVLGPRAGQGQRAWLLEQIVERTPLSHWVGRLRHEPAEIVALLPTAEEWTPVLRRGLQRAAILQEDSEWAAALLSETTDDAALGALFALLPPEQRVQLALAALTEDLHPTAGRPTVRRAREMLMHAPRPWPLELGRAVLARIDRILRADFGRANLPPNERNAGAVALCGAASGTAMPVALAADTEHLAATWDERFGDHMAAAELTRLAQTVRLRHEMTQEFA